jgi:predicted Fe-S protein YdhL (DUF1289 family)
MSETKLISHCIRECAWDKGMTQCIGCGLTRNELKNWSRMTEEEKKCALKAADKRYKALKVP